VSINCLILGESGAGKSSSLRTLDPAKTAIIQTIPKPLPFRNPELKAKTRLSDRVDEIVTLMGRAVNGGNDVVVIDDAQYMMANEFFRRAKERGFDKFAEMGADAVKLLQASMALPEHVRVYLLWHVETQDGRVKAKTIGRMLDEKYTVEGVFSIVLRAMAIDGRYLFATKTNGADTTKSPYGMFEGDFIGNDLAEVDKAICSYYDIGKVPSVESVD